MKKELSKNDPLNEALNFNKMKYLSEVDYELIYQIYCHRLEAFIYKKSPNHREDILQNIFEKLLKIPLDKFPKKQEERDKYIFTIARNEAINFNKKAKRRTHLELKEDLDKPSNPHHVTEVQHDFKAAMKTLTKNNAEAIQLKLAGYRYKEIAKKLGISESAVKKRIQRAEAQIKQFYLSQDEEKT